MPKKLYCLKHEGDVTEESAERLDHGRLTRAKCKELGISIETLTTDTGCRKRDLVAVRKSRRKTCGMLYAYRTCGISLGHIECIRSGEPSIEINYWSVLATVSTSSFHSN